MRLSLLVFILVIFSAFFTPPSYSYAQYFGPSLQGTPLGTVPSSSQVCISVLIPPKDTNYLNLLVQEIGNHQAKPLSKDQLISDFGNVQQELEVVNYLESDGFSVVYKSPFLVVGVASASTVESVFKTNLELYKYQGEVYYRPISTPYIPHDLANSLVMGLTNFTLIKPQLIPLGNLTSTGLVGSSFPNYFGFQFSALYYSGKEIQQAYNVTPGGRNVTVAVIDAYGDPELYQDLKAFDSQNGLPPINLTILPLGPYHPIFGIFSGWDVETALDVEAVHSVAPYAHVLAVIASSPSLLFQAVDLVVSEDLANVVSMSWGLPENLIGSSGYYAYFQGSSTPNYPYLDYYFELGTAEGISFFASSGDQGAFGGTTTSYGGVSFPASSPFVTAVGGTSLYLNVRSGYVQDRNATVSYQYETAWSVLPQYFEPGPSTVSSGGGVSTLFPAPWYQLKYLNASAREVPDVSADANPYTGMVVTVEGAQEVIGGTSLASPIWAGIAADMDSSLNSSLGLINPILYWIYSNSSLYHEAFHSITVGFNGVYNSKMGYNMVTGLGSPYYPGLLNAVRDYLMQKGLEISVSTFSENTTIPWYSYNTTVGITAYITFQNGTIVRGGQFNAYIYTTQGFLEKVPLTFNGTFWKGDVQVQQGQPANIWSIIVNGSSQNLNGIGQTDIDVGGSVVISQPTPYPISLPYPSNEPIPIQAQVTYPNGTPLVNSSVNAYLIKDGKVLLSVKLLPVGQGIYSGQFTVLPNMPQGTYLLLVNSTLGSTYSYVYVGNLIYGAVYTPVIDGYPGASPGENVTFFAEVFTSFGLGLFTTNVTALVYHNTTLVAEVPMVSAPEVTQFGVFSLFGLKEANFTIPGNFTPGIYKVVFETRANTSVGIQTGNFTTWFYVAPALSSSVSIPGPLYQGEKVPIHVNITFSNGTPVKSGTFSAVLVPAGQTSRSLVYESSYEVPLQYNSSEGEWVGYYTVPSFQNSQLLGGNEPGVIAGPWTVIVAGTSPLGYTEMVHQDVQVMDQTYLGNIVLNRTQPLGQYGEPYSLYQVYSPNLTVDGTSLNLVGSTVGVLKVVDGEVNVSSSSIGEIVAVNSTVTLVNTLVVGSPVGITSTDSNLTFVSSTLESSPYAFNVSGGNVILQGSPVLSPSLSVAQPPRVTPAILNVTSGFSVVNVTVSPYLTPISLYMDGVPQNFTYSRLNGSLIIHVPVKASSLPSGLYIYTLQLKNGLKYNVTFEVNNLYHDVVFSQDIAVLEVVLGVLVVVVVILFILLLRRGKR
ncbi:S8 family serine peptidase [Metallosphaera tengchongensis]|uniref:S8 family serine peptidase n=1 Tax=Metallosphaera tengchongensis TaxID=1532350 RepID=A0A6N0NQV5_9CREN|nr:protease pro-enzyme activation domain-containing protein [Metallosphaera tengchongensis]QKQ99105.1 S8 family serine peptidase [Metallosphaera tengchongensis]